MSREQQPFHWTSDPTEARQEQLALRNRLVTTPLDLSGIQYALAIGVSYSERRSAAVAVAATTLLSGQLLDPGEYYSATVETDFPYIPGLFAYREGPAICALLDSLPGLPPLVLFDAQGTAHPRGFGLAAHIGVLYDLPTMGLTRRPLFGKAEPPSEEDGAMTDVIDRRGRVLGTCVRLRARCEPVYGSPGHRTDIAALASLLGKISCFQSGYPKSLAFVHETANKLARSRLKSRDQ
ncbi:endonuclease V [Streptomyces sp.]|uniref:endonuclease V n=1 Tax=Streptomyces sp. TaxID=1931 RepID=UPI0039C9AFCF